jgi:farnesyl-diphosphate farnesyltransferase
MNKPHLGGALLESVSRSFFLSIRVLPPEVRDVIGLAYLLARASDTIADTPGTSAEMRLQLLAEFETLLHHTDPAILGRIRTSIQPDHPGERLLIAELSSCLGWLQSLPETLQLPVKGVLHKIIRGQRSDLKKFQTQDRVSAIHSPADLEQYAYLVAGCVGEFWTTICLECIPHYSTEPESVLMPWAADFGKGLQLINILRDLPADLRAGRCYLPEAQLASEGLTPESLLRDPARASSIFQFWAARAENLLQSGARYIAAVRPARVRIACFLPWKLGHETLSLMQLSPPLETGSKVKVSRNAVYRACASSLWAAISNRSLHR